MTDPAGRRPNGPVERVRAVIFDTDGVVTRTATVHAAAWKTLFDGYLEDRAEATGESFEPFDDWHRDRNHRLSATAVRQDWPAVLSDLWPRGPP